MYGIVDISEIDIVLDASGFLTAINVELLIAKSYQFYAKDGKGTEQRLFFCLKLLAHLIIQSIEKI